MRGAQSQASNAASTATNVGAGFGSSASDIGSKLFPFLQQQMTNPSGYSPNDVGAMLTQGLAGAGGTTSALQGAAAKNAATTRNPMGFSAALDSVARSRDKAAAGVGEDIAANNAKVKLGQQQSAASGLENLYGTTSGAQLRAMGLVPEDVNAEVNAGNSGWLQNLNGILRTVSSFGK